MNKFLQFTIFLLTATIAISARAQNADLPAVAPQLAQRSPQYSQLWGVNGEKWAPTSRLPDFSFAGYRSGAAPIPDVPVKANVRDFGARGDGQTDDTAAFRAAIEATNDGALLIPAGRYVITDVLSVRKPNLVLRGEGADRSVLFFPKGLEEIDPIASKTVSGIGTTRYSWKDGFVRFEGEKSSTVVGQVKTRAARGSCVLELDGLAREIKVGESIDIRQRDDDKFSMMEYLYQGETGDISGLDDPYISFVSRVTDVRGSQLTLERPLRTDVRPEWKAEVRLFEPVVRECGLEGLGFEFPSTPYLGHFKEVGFNAFTFLRVADCWARDIRIKNADSGAFLHLSTFVTLDGIEWESERVAYNGQTGHHGVTLGQDCLLTNFEFRTKFFHDITLNNGSGGNVAMRGKGVDLSLDFHRRYPHANLFTDIDLGGGERIYYGSGGDGLGNHTAAWATLWNLRSQKALSWPRANYGPDIMNFVGVQSAQASQLDPTGRWWESIAPENLQPQNLYEAQKARRLNRE